jgi:hypothetical protein
LGVEHARVEVGQQSRLLAYALRNLREISECAVAAELGERIARRPIPKFRFVPERKQNFFAPGPRAFTRQCQRVVDAHVNRRQFAWGRREGAVVADIATQLGQGREYFA